MQPTAVRDIVLISSLIAKWRIPIGDSGVLGFFLELMASQQLQEDLITQILRLVGNSCADTGL